MKEVLNKIHASFKLNGISYNSEELKEVAYSLVKEGLENEIEIGDFLLDWLSDSGSLQVLTSGSTGIPKTIKLEKDHLIYSAQATGKFLNLAPGCTALLCLPASYIAGKMMLVRAMVLGLDLYYVRPTSTPLKENPGEFDFTAMVPVQLQNDLDLLERLKIILVGGAPLSQSLIKAIQHKANAIYETFGMTETISHIAMRKLSGGKMEKNFKTLPSITVSADSRGCLCINAPKLGVNKLKTNDVVSLSSGTEFNWLGRLDNVINSGGIKLQAEPLENKLEAYISSRFMLAGVADEVLGQKLILIVEGDGNGNETDLLSQIKKAAGLQKYEVPKTVYFLDKFELTKSTKIKRKATLAKVISKYFG